MPTTPAVDPDQLPPLARSVHDAVGEDAREAVVLAVAALENRLAALEGPRQKVVQVDHDPLLDRLPGPVSL